ncbi:MAG: S24 family peptidase [Verrucomicrobia bacterium]|nr:S24 family peptidase [Verrucomicrobiota bacterium]
MRKSIDIVLSFIKEKGLTKYHVEQRSGLSNAYLANIKKTGSDIQPEKLDLIIKAFPNLESYLERTERQTGAIPLISVEAAAGFGTSEFNLREKDIQDRYVVPDFNGIDFMIRIKGPSMYPKYSSGDIVACRILKEATFIQWNKPYVIATREQGILCKRLMQSELKDHFKIVSENKEYPEFDVPKSEITGIALIVGVIRLE